MKLFLTIISFIITSSAFSTEVINTTCTFNAEGSKISWKIEAYDYDFNEEFSNNIMPVIPYFTPDSFSYYLITSEYVEVRGEERLENLERDLFLTSWVKKENITPETLHVLEILEIDIEKVSKMRVAFSTDILETLLYMEAEVNGKLTKIAMAGMYIGICK